MDRPSITDPHTKADVPRSLSGIVAEFSPFERVLFFVLSVVLVISGAVLATDINRQFLVEIPADGGSFREGVVGSPRFINPLLAQTDVDRDLTQLIYAGLMIPNAQGNLEYDLAEGHTVSEDGLSYTFRLRDDIFFHDGEPVTADDVIFTVTKVQDATLNSPKRASWQGVSVEKVNDREIIFQLDRPYAPFLENLTLGILPEHIWSSARTEEYAFSQFNIQPVGSGPYSIRRIQRNSSGIPEYYQLTAYDQYALGKPHIERIEIQFYPNENALIDGYINREVDAINGVSTNNLEYAKLNVGNIHVEQVPLPRVFGLFFNQNQAPVLSNIEVRAALQKAVNKERIVNEVLDGYATVIDSPIPPGIIPQSELQNDEEDPNLSGKKEAIDILERNGWEIDEDSGVWIKETDDATERLTFSISTSNAPDLKRAAELVQEDWEEIGAEVNVLVFETGDLNQNVIRTREYDTLLFGLIVGRDLDLFPFWHSSQRNDPGLNVSLYANISADALLEDARTIADKDERLQKFIEFNTEIQNDIPAVFLYSPDFLYIAPDNVEGIELGTITTPSERFVNVHEWYIYTEDVWSGFVQEN